jgi:hypothetical protein
MHLPPLDHITARHHQDLSSSTPFGLVSQPRQENHVACGQVGLGGCFVARTNYGAYVVVAVADIAAAVVAIHRRPMLVADFGDEDARSTGSVANEGGRRKDRYRRLKAKAKERAGGSCGFEA